MDLINYVVVLFFLSFSGLFSGLTLGLMSLDPFDLKRKVKLNDKYAKRIYPLRKRGNLLLCTLLLANVAVNAGLAVFLGSITAGVIAGLIATGLIVIFGEIVPQAVFSKYGLALGGRIAWLVYIFLFLLYPITKPLSMLLDSVLGGELPTIFSKREFRLLVQEQKKHMKTDISEDEFEILEGGLEFSERTVKDVMTPVVNTFVLKQETVLDKEKLNEIHARGHSRIPVYNEISKKVVGILYAKDLVAFGPDDKKIVKAVMRRKVYFIKETDKLGKVLDIFKKNRIHLLIVLNQLKLVSGIVTLEDVLEEIVGEIVDEYDRFVDMRKIS